MATVFAKVTGATVKEISAKTVQEAKDALGLSGNYTAVVNGEAADLSDSLSENQSVIFSEQVKGGC